MQQLKGMWMAPLGTDWWHHLGPGEKKMYERLFGERASHRRQAADLSHDIRNMQEMAMNRCKRYELHYHNFNGILNMHGDPE